MAPSENGCICDAAASCSCLERAPALTASDCEQRSCRVTPLLAPSHEPELLAVVVPRAVGVARHAAAMRVQVVRQLAAVEQRAERLRAILAAIDGK